MLYIENKENEIWRGVIGYEDLYQVSSFGRVRSLPRICRRLEGKVMKEYLYEGKLLTPYRDQKGYYSVRLYRNDKTHDMKVHRIVALAFLPNPDNLPQINHRDENKANNRVWNLEWCDGKYNRNYGSSAARFKKPVAQYDKEGNFIARFPSSTDAGRATKIAQSLISAAALGKIKTAGGFIWRY